MMITQLKVDYLKSVRYDGFCTSVELLGFSSEGLALLSSSGLTKGFSITCKRVLRLIHGKR